MILEIKRLTVFFLIPKPVNNAFVFLAEMWFVKYGSDSFGKTKTAGARH